MFRFGILVWCLALCQFDLNIAKNIGTTASPFASDQRALVIQTKLLKIQDDIISITAAIAFAENLDTLKEKVKTADENFEQIKEELAEERRQQHDSSAKTIILLNTQYNAVSDQLNTLHTSIEEYKKKQLPTIVVSDIKERRFKSAGEKLDLLSNFDDVLKIVRTVYQSCSDSFGLLATFTENLQNTQVIFHTVKALSAEMNESGHKNPFNWMRLVKTMQTAVIGKSNVDAQTLSGAQAIVAELQNSIRMYALDALKTAAAHVGSFEQNDELDNLETDLFRVDPDQSESIIQQFVNESYGLIRSKKILGTVESHRFIEQVVKGIETLFGKLEDAGNHNSDVMFNIATALHNITLDDRFDELSEEKRHQVNKMIKKLPLCARNIIFEPSVCLWNKAKEEYLAAADSKLNYDSERRNIFAVDTLPESHWKVESKGDNFLFSSRAYAYEYLYAAAFSYNKELRYVFSWIPKNNTDIQSEWSIELEDDYCYIKSAAYNDFLFASSLRRPNDMHMRNVFTWIPGTEVRGPEFQWQIRNCDKMDKMKDPQVDIDMMKTAEGGALFGHLEKKVKFFFNVSKWVDLLSEFWRI